ncbi:MAG TPA: CBS domain-containing protein [Candidatus Binatia bacterium]|jgi:acetoin utilization protein AcuB|nr:CBS domain-containing protein [Candidatus Binatia bacterium]
MLVKERMSKPVIFVPPEMPILEALKLMQREKIRRTPVIQDGKMVGIVSDKDLLNAAPSDATSLNMWELNYLVSRIQVKEVMTRDVCWVSEDTPIEEAARIMADNKIGGLPVMRDGRVVGLITETDLFRILLELMGARERGLCVTAIIPDRIGELAEITNAMADCGASFVAFGQYAGDDTATRMVTFKVINVDEGTVRAQLEPLVERITDVRETA